MSILKQVQGEKNFHEIINFRRKLKVFGKYSEPAKMNDSELAFFLLPTPSSLSLHRFFNLSVIDLNYQELPKAGNPY